MSAAAFVIITSLKFINDDIFVCFLAVLQVELMHFVLEFKVNSGF